ncbi:hypothetical protein HDU76_000077 [Blyttiomyces sp. JEL0837]|nr:hypothetical protein HDU76_000077 [Blyttiomyces sp. JEL0837]
MITTTESRGASLTATWDPDTPAPANSIGIISMAIVIQPPPNTPGLDRVQMIRSTGDKVFEKWPPHLTVLPYDHLPKRLIPDPTSVYRLLASAASTHRSFQIKLDTVSVFWHHGGSATVVLEPSLEAEEVNGAVRTLDGIHKALIAALPANVVKSLKKRHHSPSPMGYGIRPHLTIATFESGTDRNAVMSFVEEIRREGLVIGFEVSGLSWMVKADDHGSQYKSVPMWELKLMN